MRCLDDESGHISDIVEEARKRNPKRLIISINIFIELRKQLQTKAISATLPSAALISW